jgi:WD40 repeat protein
MAGQPAAVDESEGTESTEAFTARLARPLRIFKVPISANVACMIPSQHHLIVACRNATLAVIDLNGTTAPRVVRSGITVRYGTPITMAAEALASTSESARSMVNVFYSVGGSDVYFAKVDLTSGALSDDLTRLEPDRNRGQVTAVACAQQQLYVASTDRCIRLFSSRNGSLITMLEEDVSPPSSISLNLDRRQLVTCSNEGAGAVSVWRTPILMMRTSGSKRSWLRQWCGLGVSQILASTVVDAGTGSADGTRQLECLHTFVAGSAVHTALLVTGGSCALTANQEGDLHVLDLERKRIAVGWTFSLFGHTGPLRALALSGDATCTASATGCELHVSRCPPNAPSAIGTATSIDPAASTIEDVLRGIQEAADELESPGAR